MNVVSLLIKPASGQCNLRCHYCFYHDLLTEKQGVYYDVMSTDTLFMLLKDAFCTTKDALVLSFQGGEPLLAGISYYEMVIKLVDRFNNRRIPVSFSIQTNGILLNNEWCHFLKDHHFLVGISLDGPMELHEANRGPNYQQVLSSIQLLEQYQIEFNVLSVVTKQHYQEAKHLYQFFKEQHLPYLQFIPCVPLHQKSKKEEYCLTSEEYFVFLDDLFSCWFQDIMGENPVSIRLFDNFVAILLGLKANSCDLNQSCGVGVIVEANGDCYPCDFFVEKDYFLGNVLTSSLTSVLENPVRKAFSESSKRLLPTCLVCPFRSLCQGGCQKYRNQSYIYCETMKRFFNKHIIELQTVAHYFKKCMNKGVNYE
ncbi:MAG: radical SAM protein [Bacilli bacterium]